VYRPDADPAETFRSVFDSVREFAKPKCGVDLLKLETLPRRPDHPAQCGLEEFSGSDSVSASLRKEGLGVLERLKARSVLAGFSLWLARLDDRI
jgi:hypothetical protein